MAGKTTITLPLLRLGRLQLDHGLRALPVGPAASGPVVTATVSVPDTPVDRSYEWDVAWADVSRQAGQLGADTATVEALPTGAGPPTAGGGRPPGRRRAARGGLPCPVAPVRDRRDLGAGRPAAALARGGGGRGAAARLPSRAGGR